MGFLDCFCQDLNIAAMGDLGISNDILDGCTICDQPDLGNGTLEDYQTVDLACNIHNSHGGYGGVENAYGFTESLGLVVGLFSKICLPETRGGLAEPTANSL